MAHMTSKGIVDWVVQAGGTDEDKARAVSSDGNGGAFVAGYFYYTASFGGKTLTSSEQSGFVMHVTSACRCYRLGCPGRRKVQIHRAGRLGRCASDGQLL